MELLKTCKKLSVARLGFRAPPLGPHAQSSGAHRSGFRTRSPPTMGIRARRLRGRKSGGVHDIPGFEGAFEDSDDFVTKPTSRRYAEHQKFVERESARRRRKGAAMDWLIYLVGFLISTLATCVAAVIHLVFPVKPRDESSGAFFDASRDERRRSRRTTPRTENDSNHRRDSEDESDALYLDGGALSIRACFLVLGVRDEHRTATQKEIEKKYRALAVKWHPDKNDGDQRASARMQTINVARTRCIAEVKRRTRSRIHEANDRCPAEGERDAAADDDQDDFFRDAEKEASRETRNASSECRDRAKEQREERLRARRVFIEKFGKIVHRHDRQKRDRMRVTYVVVVVSFALAAVFLSVFGGVRRRNEAPF